MIIAIIAGGSGTRLWPLSTPDYPKHLLKINRDRNSLLQNTYNRAKQLSDTIYIVSEASHIQHVKEQLPNLTEDQFIVEPARRGTASCILATLAHIATKHGNEEPIAFLAADHYIRDTAGFVHSFKIAADIARVEERIVLVGTEPSYPATGFGYIKKDGLFSEEMYVYNVDSFQEKPNHPTAQDYFKSGNYLWNCGYFIGSIATFKGAMERYAPELFVSYQKLASAKGEEYETTYLGLENISIDYALIEKVQNLLVVPASFDWMDLGTYIDLSKAVEADEVGNHVHGALVELEGVNNSFVENYEDKPVAVIGLDNCVVVNTPQGLLVTRKDLSQKVGDVSKRFHKS